MSRVARPLLTQGVRRTLSLAVLVCLGLVLTLTPLSDPLPEWTRPVGTEISRRACLERRELWSAFFLAMLPVLVWRAATLGNLWRTRDVAWLGVLPWSRGALGFSFAAGVFLATVLAGGLALFVFSRSIAGHDAPVPNRVHTFEHEPLLLTGAEGTSPRELALEGSPHALDAIQLALSVAPGSGPAVDVELALVGASGESAPTRVRLSGRTPIRLPCPDPGPWRLVLTRGSGAVVYLSRSSVHGLAAGRPGQADFALFVRTTAGLASWALLALGLGTCMRLSLAIATSLSISLVPWTLGEGVEAILIGFPAGDLGQSLALLGEGIAPGPLPLGSWLTPLALMFVAGAMLRAALLRGSRP